MSICGGSRIRLGIAAGDAHVHKRNSTSNCSIYRSVRKSGGTFDVLDVLPDGSMPLPERNIAIGVASKQQCPGLAKCQRANGLLPRWLPELHHLWRPAGAAKHVGLVAKAQPSTV